MKRVVSLLMIIMMLLSLCACKEKTVSKENDAHTDSQGDTEKLQETLPVIYEKWAQPEQSDLKDFLKEKVDTFSTQVLNPDDVFYTELQNHSYDEIEDSELYSTWKTECLSWAYGAQNFDISKYECDTALEKALQNCGEMAYKFPDAFKASYYRISENASQDFSAIADGLQAELYALVDMIYAKDVESLSIGDLLEGNKFVSLTFENVYYEDDKLSTKSGNGIVYIVPAQQSILVLEFTVKNVFSQALSYSNTGIVSMDDYVKISAVFNDLYEYDSDIYVEDSYGYNAVMDSFLDVTPLSERPIYAIIQVPVSAKEMSALISIEYNGIVYHYSM